MNEGRYSSEKTEALLITLPHFVFPIVIDLSQPTLLDLISILFDRRSIDFDDVAGIGDQLTYGYIPLSELPLQGDVHRTVGTSANYMHFETRPTVVAGIVDVTDPAEFRFLHPATASCTAASCSAN